MAFKSFLGMGSWNERRSSGHRKQAHSDGPLSAVADATPPPPATDPLAATSDAMAIDPREEEKAAATEAKADPYSSSQVSTLVVCASGIYVCYLAYGILQEKLFSTRYPNNEGTEMDRFSFVQLLVFMQCTINALLTQILQAINFCMERSTGNNQGKFRLCVSKDMATLIAMSSASYVGAMSCSNTALKYVNYPTQALGKSCKMIPVMLFGVLWNKKKHTWPEYLAVVMVSLGIGCFSIFGKTKAHHASGSSSTPLGLVLLFTSLCLDGAVGATQDRIVAKFNPSSVELMRLINAGGAIWLAITLVLTGEGVVGTMWCLDHLSALYDMLLFSMCSAAGQMFIFLCIRQFGSLVCTTVTTTRKFFTVLASIVWYGHHLKSPQWVSIFVVFGGIGIKLVQSWKKRLGGEGGAAKGGHGLS